MNRLLSSCCLLLTLAPSLAFSSPRWIGLSPDPNALELAPSNGVNTKTTYMIAMRDGVQLATDVYLSQNPGKWPAILVRTPYGKTLGTTEALGVQLLVNLGYAVVVQDMRGRFASQGVDSLFLDDGWGETRRDGYDTIEWVAAQEWCNGKVGTWGASALGINQYLTAGSAPPSLVCQFVEVAAMNLYSQAAYPGGVFLKNLIEQWVAGQGSAYLIPFVVAHPNYDDTWARLNLENRFERVNVPIYHWGGWHDIFTEGTINAFAGIQKHGGTRAAGKQKLVMGPWTHGGWSTARQGELSFPSNSTFNDLSETIRWFEYWLLGRDNGIMSEPAVRYYVMGAIEPGAPGNEWRTAQEWPPEAQSSPFYLHGGGELSPAKPAASQASLSYVYDPANPVPTIGGRNLMIPAGPYDQRLAESRSDVLLFTTPVLTEPLEIAGNVRGRLWVSSTARDTDFMVKLTDVYPDGRSMLVADGAVRGRHRDSIASESFMTPDSIYLCEVDLWSTAIIFNRGHRIRVAVTSSNSPRFDPNPNTGKPFRADNEKMVATNTIHLSASNASHLLLPVTTGATSVALNESNSTPGNFALSQNFPNPLSNQSEIKYTLKRTAVVRLSVFNSLGQEVQRLVDGLAPQGLHQSRWDGKGANGELVANGIYFYRLEVEGAAMTRKMMLMR